MFKFQWKKKLIRRIIKGIFRRQNKKTSLSYNFTNYIVVQTKCAITKQLPTHQAYHRSIKEISSVEAIILRTCIPKIEEKIGCKSDYFHEHFFPWFHSKWSKWFKKKKKNIDDFYLFWYNCIPVNGMLNRYITTYWPSHQQVKCEGHKQIYRNRTIFFNY